MKSGYLLNEISKLIFVFSSIIREFRMSELHELLKFAGQTRSGKKDALIVNIIEFLKIN